MSELLSTARLISLPRQVQPSGDLVVAQGMLHVPFSIARVFVVRGQEGALRGQHAHRRCVQFLICTHGSIVVKCTDGKDSTEFTLDRPESGLLIPAGIWAAQTYKVADSVLTVLCDQPYEPDDYIRDFENYKAFRRSESPFPGKKYD